MGVDNKAAALNISNNVCLIETSKARGDGGGGFSEIQEIRSGWVTMYDKG